MLVINLGLQAPRFAVFAGNDEYKLVEAGSSYFSQMFLKPLLE